MLVDEMLANSGFLSSMAVAHADAPNEPDIRTLDLDDEAGLLKDEDDVAFIRLCKVPSEAGTRLRFTYNELQHVIELSVKDAVAVAIYVLRSIVHIAISLDELLAYIVRATHRGAHEVPVCSQELANAAERNLELQKSSVADQVDFSKSLLTPEQRTQTARRTEPRAAIHERASVWTYAALRVYRFILHGEPLTR